MWQNVIQQSLSKGHQGKSMLSTDVCSLSTGNRYSWFCLSDSSVHSPYQYRLLVFNTKMSKKTHGSCRKCQSRLFDLHSKLMSEKFPDFYQLVCATGAFKTLHYSHSLFTLQSHLNHARFADYLSISQSIPIHSVSYISSVCSFKLNLFGYLCQDPFNLSLNCTHHVNVYV